WALLPRPAEAGAGAGAGWRQPLAGMNPGPQGGGPVGPALRRPAEVGTAHEAPADTLEHIARVLLRRYGVVFWRLLEREADWLPPWRELLWVYHRLEARGEIRG